VLTILHRHRATTWAALPVLFAASLALGACSQGTDPQSTAQAAVTGAPGDAAGTAAADPAATTTKAAGSGSKSGTKAGNGSSGSTDPATSTTKQSGKPSGEGVPPDMSQGGPRTVVINVHGKDVTPKPGSIKVKKGEQLLLVVVTDQDGELHIHGLDIEKKTKKGLPTQIPLVFHETGSFEVELHDPALLLTKIVVS
jgi:hypothetical protein